MHVSHNWKLRTGVIIRPLEPLQLPLEKGTGFLFCAQDSGPALVSWAEADGFHFCVVSTRASSRDALADTHACSSSLALLRDMFFSLCFQSQCSAMCSVNPESLALGSGAGEVTLLARNGTRNPKWCILDVLLCGRSFICALRTQFQDLPGHVPKVLSLNKTVAMVPHPHFAIIK